ncbi:uncharacterized protein LOC129580772 [Paramacrobiotus metropolitanus]|uniref:uncharacterized protein LOC129580772 n=1 Tax=Paramacrobiotus metropolitanus TaxID=2943436 RepID=UPI002445E38B|nr:uncharacterized protein LOC129580772 [Paramacrobiotus metropolitanus]
MFSNNRIWCYGAVDVKDDDGFFRHGMITDMDMPRGFIIDFGYPDHHAELIPFHRCFGKISHNRFAARNTVQILWRGSVNEAYRWYPAIVIAGSSYTVPFVVTQRHGEIVKEVVRRSWMMQLEERPPIKLQKFNRHSSSAGWIATVLGQARSREDLQFWNRQQGIRDTTILVKLERGKLIYISCFPEAYSFWDPLEIFQSMMAKRKTVKELKKASKSTTPYNYQACINACLPAETFRQIFFFLEFPDQLNCRRVCSSWHHILTSAPTCLQLDFNLQKNMYWAEGLALTFDRNISQSTRNIILSSNSERTYHSANPTGILIVLLKAKNIKVQTITVSNLHIWAPDIFSWSSSSTLQI